VIGPEGLAIDASNRSRTAWRTSWNPVLQWHPSLPQCRSLQLVLERLMDHADLLPPFNEPMCR